LELVAGSDPDVELCTGRAGFKDGVEGVSCGGADLAGFFPGFQGPGIAEPVGLGGKAPGTLREFVFGPDSSR